MKPKPNPPPIGPRIRAARVVAGLTQQVVAQAVGITQGYLSYMECGRRSPSLAALKRLAKALGVTAGSLVD